MNPELLAEAKSLGFSDRQIAHLTRRTEDEVRALVPELASEQVASVAVGFLHAFVNGAHERLVREILNEELPEIPVSLSCEVSPEMREWERFSTTVANAYVQPMMARYLRQLDADLRAAGFTAPL